MGDKVTAPKLREMKARSERIVCLTAYDASFGKIADSAGVDVILVGDSAGNVVFGHRTTIPVDLADMVLLTSAVRRGVNRALLVADMPFGSYQASTEQAVNSAVALMKAGADAVKLEGPYDDAIRAICKAGIPVMGHVGFTPQSVNGFGGFKIQGKGDSGSQVIDDAKTVDSAGAFGIVLELIPAELASRITTQVDAPTIGIGAGAECSGQIQVLHDIWGLTDWKPKHARTYADGQTVLTEAIRSYATDVREGAFPGPENSF